MTTRNVRTVADEAYTRYPAFRVGTFPGRRFQPALLGQVLDRLLASSGGSVCLHATSPSFEGRPVRVLKAGSGTKASLLLWSQMHGDEPTATMALCDILRFLSETSRHEPAWTILSSLTLYVLPMLNPDGAERFQRRTAQGIDMNRDARTLATPEARFLAGLRRELAPSWAFNLHDQELSTAGPSGAITALGLLAPSPDEHHTATDASGRSQRLAALFAASVGKWLPGQIARYDDAFEPRAFGDTMQQAGTSTLLVESGHIPGDPEKEEIRRLNVAGILASLYGIATGEVEKTATAPYDSLPMNAKRAYDCIIRNVRIRYGNGVEACLDLGLSSQVDTHSEPPLKLVDLGDLSTFRCLEEKTASGVILPASALELGAPFDRERWLGSLLPT